MYKQCYVLPTILHVQFSSPVRLITEENCEVQFHALSIEYRVSTDQAIKSYFIDNSTYTCGFPLYVQDFGVPSCMTSRCIYGNGVIQVYLAHSDGTSSNVRAGKKCGRKLLLGGLHLPIGAGERRVQHHLPGIHHRSPISDAPSPRSP